MAGLEQTTLSTGVMPPRRSSRYERRFESILKAASELFAEKGFEAASVRDVASRAGIGLSGIYYYFKNKEELLLALQRHTFSSLISSLEKRLARTSSPEDRLRAVIENHFATFSANMDELKVCAHEMETLSGEAYESVFKLRREYYDRVYDVMREITGGPESETTLVTLYLFGALNWAYMWFDTDEHEGAATLTNTLASIFLDGAGQITKRRKH